MSAVAIFRTGGIGDVILSTVALTILRAEAPGVRVHWFGRGSTLDLIRTAFPEVSIHEFVAGASYRQNVRTVLRTSEKFDLILDLQRSARTMMIGIVCAARFSCRYITWNKYSLRRSMMVLKAFLAGRSRHVKQSMLPRRYEAMAGLVAREAGRQGWMKGGGAIYVPAIHIPSAKRSEGAAIAINLGALYPSKELPFTHWQTIVRHIADHRLCTHLHFLGDMDKSADADRLIATLSATVSSTNHCGKTSLTEAATILASCRSTLSADTALAHLSESVGTPVIIFFGPTHEGFGYRPFLPGSLAVSHPLSCRPCTKDGDTRCRFGDFLCFAALDIRSALHHLHFLNASPA